MLNTIDVINGRRQVATQISEMMKHALFYIFGILCLTLLVSTTSFAVEKRTYLHTDHLGSVIAATDASGQLVWREEYEPYGFKRLTPTEADDQRLWYTGHAHDEAMSLSYFGARWYDPEAGRFLAVDPVDWFKDSPVHSFNRYAYANNNPYKFVDPDGGLPIVPIAIFIAKELAGEIFEQAIGVPVTVKGIGKRALKKGGEASFSNIPRRAAPSGGSPALKGDPYNHDSVTTRQKDWQKIYGGFDPKAVAADLGYGKRIPPQKAPFDSHGQPVFSSGRGYISPDVDGHSVTNGWKMFDKKGRRTGTWNSDLSKRLKD